MRAPNASSMRVLEKCDYTLDGILRADVRKEGVFHDIHHYALNRIRASGNRQS